MFDVPVQFIIIQDGKSPLQLAQEGKEHDTVKFLEFYLQQVPNILYCYKYHIA